MAVASGSPDKHHPVAGILWMIGAACCFAASLSQTPGRPSLRSLLPGKDIESRGTGDIFADMTMACSRRLPTGKTKDPFNLNLRSDAPRP